MNTKDVQLSELYQKLERLVAAGEVASAYGGAQDIDNPDGDVLSEFIEFIDEFYPDNRAEWLEAFYQVFAWQFQSCHEGVCTYYSNFYNLSEHQTIEKTSAFLKETKYTELSQAYSTGLDAGQSEYAQIDKWINSNLELVWEFYVDILARRKILCKRFSTKSRPALRKRSSLTAGSLASSISPRPGWYARRLRRECRPRTRGILREGISRRSVRRTGSPAG